MRLFKTTTVAAALLLFGAAGCADLDVQNPNDPTRDQALASALDVESLIAGSYNTWYNGVHHWGNTLWISNASFQSVSTAANAGNIDHSGIPRTPIINDAAYGDYGFVVERTWQRAYRALAAVADGIRTLDNNPDLSAELDDQVNNGDLRARAFGKMVQGLGHAMLAVWYDQGFVIDETTDLTAEQTPVPYTEMLNAALGYFDEAISLANSGSFTIPDEWMSVNVSSAEIVPVIHAWKAIYRASVPRTPGEAVDWNAVMSDLGNASTFTMEPAWTGPWYNGAFDINGGPNGWAAQSYFIIGMADQSGQYQQWLSQPVGDRLAWFGATQDDNPFLINTPDTRFPTGTTPTEQINNPGEYYVIPTNDTWTYDVAEHFTRPARGTWRWSWYYYPTSFNYWFGIDFTVPMVTQAELDLLMAEALLETGDAAGAAALVNQYRTQHGLAATDAGGTNTDCVPRLPDNSCGNLMEMLKWEKRLETATLGLNNVGWFWDARRWGDHYSGTPLQWPIPDGELQTLQMEHYTFGGCGESPPSASDGSSYNWPGEC